jgi:hypothetical protein
MEGMLLFMMMKSGRFDGVLVRVDVVFDWVVFHSFFFVLG